MTNGLVQHYDGINNTSAGHSNTTTVWEDLIGNNTGVVKIDDWDSDCLQFNGNNRVSYRGDITNQYTIMGVFSYQKVLTSQYPRIIDGNKYPGLYIFNNGGSPIHADAWAFRLYASTTDTAFSSGSSKVLPSD